MGYTTDFRPGELVDITIKGARVEETLTPDFPAPVLVVKYRIEDGHQRWQKVAVRPDAPGLTIERVAPAEWPPRLGDLWRSAPTQSAPRGELWLACESTTDDGTSDEYVPMRSATSQYLPADDVLQYHGPVELVHREATDGES